jgi:hypothetical protein
MWPCVAVRGSSYFATVFSYWLRKFSPRVKIILEEELERQVTGPRSLRLVNTNALAILSREAFNVLYYPSLNTNEHASQCFHVHVEEPRLENTSISLSDGLLSVVKSKGKIVLPPCLHSAQIALYAKRAGLDVKVCGPVNDDAPREFLDQLNSYLSEQSMITSEMPDPHSGELCRPGVITFSAPSGVREEIRVYPFFDENVTQWAAYIALRILGLDAKIGKPIPLRIIEDTGKLLLAFFGSPVGETSVKVALNEGSFCRILLSRRERKIEGVFCKLLGNESSKLGEVLAGFIEKSDPCKLMPGLAITESELFREDRLLRALASIWFKLCY